MDPRTERAAKAICARERGPNARECKTCNGARYRYNPEIKDDEYVDLPDGCLGLGFEYLAVAGLGAADGVGRDADSGRKNAEQIILDRIELYRGKRDRHDPLGADTLNEYEKVTHTIEALEHLLAEVRSGRPPAADEGGLSIGP